MVTTGIAAIMIIGMMAGVPAQSVQVTLTGEINGTQQLVETSHASFSDLTGIRDG